MKRNLLAVVSATLLLALALPLLLCFALPMDDAVYNLSVLPEDGQETLSGGNGWSLYTNEAGQVAPLISDGLGGYTGLSYPGQTFYFSRTLDQQLQSPTLRIAAGNRTVSVFLDDELLYTDCPNRVQRIGFLSLPMLEYDRTVPLTISLPDGYTGKTLTIAQSSSVHNERQDDSRTVYPCEVTLYCGYAYESSLIAQTARVMIPAALAFALGLFLLAVFLWQTLADHHSDPSLALLALLAFLMMAVALCRAPFLFKYFGLLAFDPAELVSLAVVTVFLTFFACRVRRRIPMLALAGLQGGTLLVYLWSQLHAQDAPAFAAPQPMSLFALLAALFLCLLEWRETIFCRVFTLTILVLGVVVLCVGALLFAQADHTLNNLPGLTTQSQLSRYFLRIIEPLCLVGGLFAAAVHTVSGLIRRHTEASILSSKVELAQRSYESLRAQSEQVMMLRHDLNHHLHALQSMLHEDKLPQAANYIATLIGQNQAVRPVVSCGNAQLDIILNGKLDAAIRAGVRVEIVRAEAPATLPLNDAELTSLTMNLMDNAVRAAINSPPTDRFIRLELRVKHAFFTFSCTNSAPEAPSPSHTSPQTPLPSHGYGLRIVQRIVERHGGLLRLQPSPGSFHVSFVLPLH